MDKVYSVVVDRPAEKVFRYVINPENIPRWAPYVTGVEVRPDGPLAPGSEIAQTVRGRQSIWTVTELIPNQLCRYEADYWYARAQVTYRVEPANGGTRFTIHDRARRPGLMKLASPILNLIDSYYRRRQMQIIKEDLERTPSLNSPSRRETDRST